MKHTRSRKKWTAKEKEALSTALTDPTLHPRKILISGRSPCAIERMARKLGLRKYLTALPWSPQECALLRRLHKVGLTTTQIHALDAFNRNKNAIEKKRSRLRLIRSRRRSKAAKHRKMWQNGELERFKTFLKKNSKIMATEEMAILFNVSIPTVRKHQRQLDVNLPWQEAMDLPYNIQKKKLGIQKLRRKLLRNSRKKDVSRTQILLNLAQKYRRKNPDVLEKRCPTCQHSFPKSQFFFYHRDTHRPTMTSRTFDYQCKACTSIYRRNMHQKKRRRSLRKK
jgi:hypothetical protein